MLQSEDFLKNGSKKTLVYYIMAKLLTNFWTRPDFVAYNAKNYKNLSYFLSTKQNYPPKNSNKKIAIHLKNKRIAIANVRKFCYI